MTPTVSILPSREPRFAPMTECDQEVLAVVTWLEREGYIPAATVLRAVVGRHQIVTLEELRADEDTLERLKQDLDLPCRIWSGEHSGYWRPDGHGYSRSALSAGVYIFWAAYATTSHCGPEKEIAYEILPVAATETRRASGWKS